ncbi:helix-turn-helix domain-containing protein [Tenacibaculum halocynthiae]|uniref:helix-turn-helix domain-containing protein n=1 Tax=Tenacibaculum halocynthiae TaxID=1254437 RepID=UPI003893B52D
MNTIILPDELNLNSSMSVSIYDYNSNKEVSKQQIVLNKNTFSFLQEGTKEVFFDDSSCTINNSQFLLMKSGNCLMTEKLSNVSESYRSILLFFSNEDVLKFIRKFEFNLTKKTTRYSTNSFDYDSFLNRFVDSLLEISKLSISLQKKMLEVKFEEVLLYLVEIKGVSFLHSLVNEVDSQHEKFIQTVEMNKLNKLTIKELSFLTNMSVSTFKREFEKYFHTSPSKWFQDKRLEHAAFLLKNESKRPTEIFEEVGYESLSSFIQAFKGKFGVTPKQY